MKQVILMRTDLGMKKGKMCAQAAHAAVEIARRIPQNHPWYFEGMPKIVVKVQDYDELLERITKAQEAELLSFTVMDKTLQQFTCGAIGPAPDDVIDKITGDLQLL